MRRLRTLPSKGPRAKPSWGTGSGKALAKASARASGKALGAGSDRHDPCNNRVALGQGCHGKNRKRRQPLFVTRRDLDAQPRPVVAFIFHTVL